MWCMLIFIVVLISYSAFAWILPDDFMRLMRELRVSSMFDAYLIFYKRGTIDRDRFYLDNARYILPFVIVFLVIMFLIVDW